LGSIYYCYVYDNPNIKTEESAEISEISGGNWYLQSNDDVLGFYAISRTIQFFPKGLDKFFKNLKLIHISSCQLKEIHQSDLKVFPNLVCLHLIYNQIEIIEEELLDFNPNLEAVAIQEPRIVHIDPNVFDHLTKLSYFWFYYVPCIDKNIYNWKEKVQEVLKVVKSNCSNSEFLSLDNQIKNLEIESETLHFEDFKTKLEIFEKSFNNSKFSKFRPLNYQFQNIKLIPGCTDCIKLNENSSLNANDVNLGNSLEGNIILTSFLLLVLHFLFLINF